MFILQVTIYYTSIDCTSVVDNPLHRHLSISGRKWESICSRTSVNDWLLFLNVTFQFGCISLLVITCSKTSLLWCFMGNTRKTDWFI